MTVTTALQLRAIRRSLLWRLHFWAALISSPFAIVACLTGLLYVFTPQIERSMYRSLDTVAPAGERLPLDRSVDAARRAAPDGFTLHSVLPAIDPRDSVRVAFVPAAPRDTARPTAAAPSAGDGHAGHAVPPAMPATPRFLRPNFGVPERAVVVYVNPYTAAVLGSLPERDRFGTWARKLHSSLQQGDGWRWMIELAASWMMVMLLTGIVLWWPRAGQPGLPVAGAKGRLAWKQWHAFIGIVLSLVSVVMLTTGLTWSRTAGGQVRWARDAAGQAPPRIPAHFKSTPTEGTPMLTWEQAWQAIRQQAPEVATQVMPPAGRDGFWRANHLEKKGQPLRSFDLLVDAYSGKQLYFSDWSDQTAFGKATAIGIPFHRGEFGVWNQAILFLFGAGVLFSLVSGWMMVFRRLRAGAPLFPPVPARAWRRVSPWTLPLGLAMMVAMPLLAASAWLPVMGEVALALGSRRRSPEPAR
ncbi:MAG: PepSY domain-containing protein [Proteobacteria bacterium]|nr:PepSY domain-containing protein [Pseudomonadota bacterium]